MGIQRLSPGSASGAEHEDALLGEQVREAAAGAERERIAVTVERHAALDARADLLDQHDKVADRAEMDVRRLVPGVVQQLRDRHAAAKQETQTDAPEAEIRERDDRPPADAQQFLDDMKRAMRRLQGPAQYDDI